MGRIHDAWKHWYRQTAVSIAPGIYWRTRYRLRGFEEPELALLPLLCRPGSTVVDVGANFGMYTYWLAAQAGRCVAFEPIPKLAAALARGFGKDVEVQNVALSDQRGTAELIVPRISPGLSTIEPKNRAAASQQGSVRIQVEKRLLDDYSLDDVSFVKIDVEGHEEAVIRGALRLLGAERPNLLLELEERHNPGCLERVRNLLLEIGLAGAALVEGSLVKLRDHQSAQSVLDEHTGLYVKNFLFTRCERIDELVESVNLQKRAKAL